VVYAILPFVIGYEFIALYVLRGLQSSVFYAVLLIYL